MSNIKYFYIRTKKNDPRRPATHRGDPIACVAYQRRRDTDLPGNDLVTYSFSACSNKKDEKGRKDEFSKAEARSLAVKRLTVPKEDEKPMEKAYGFNVDPKTSNGEVLAFILDEIQSYSWAPSRVRRACRQWLTAGDKADV